MVSDTERMMMAFHTPIMAAALQTYDSALAFTPKRTTLYRTFCQDKHMMGLVRVLSGVRAEWDECLATLEGHRDCVRLCTFSPDGEKIASCSDDKTIRIWVAKSGACMHILEGHRDRV